VGIGVGCIVASHLGQATGELLATAASQRIRRPEARVRMACEVTFLVVGGLMGGKRGALVGAAIGGGAASIYEASRRR